jgi:hypothetical protein
LSFSNLYHTALERDNTCRTPWIRHLRALTALLLIGRALATHAATETTAEIRSATVEGQFDGDKARLVIQADLKGTDARDRALHSASFRHTLRVTPDRVLHTVEVQATALRGTIDGIAFTLNGDGDVREIKAQDLEDWSVRRSDAGVRSLVLRFKKSQKPRTAAAIHITAETAIPSIPASVRALAYGLETEALAHGYVRIDRDSEISARLEQPDGLLPVPEGFAVTWPKPQTLGPSHEAPPTYRFLGTSYALPLLVTFQDPEAQHVTLSGFRLRGRVRDSQVAFVLNATAHVKNSRGGRLALLSGGAALTTLQLPAEVRLGFENDQVIAQFPKPGAYPIELGFDAAVRSTNGWQTTDFAVAPSALQPLTIEGLEPDAELRLEDTARPQASTNGGFTSFLPANGRVRLAWKSARAEAQGKLFFAAQAMTQISLSPGLMRQVTALQLQVLQGELDRLTLRLSGNAGVTRVQGSSVLAWTIEEASPGNPRRLRIQFNAPQKGRADLTIQLEQSLASFPLAIDTPQLAPEGATRFSGHLQVVNEGAVRIEVTRSAGLSQIAPEQLPKLDPAAGVPPATGRQLFAFRFATPELALQLHADTILPELSVSQVITYHLGETDLAIEADIELDIREAATRELLLRVPKGYAIARLHVPGLADYFVTDAAASTEQGSQELRLVYAAPVADRQLIQLRLERNQPLNDSRWTLPRIDVLRAKSVRGHIGVAADPGLRVTPSQLSGLTDVATAFFPKKLEGIQASFRVSDALWLAALSVERLPQTIHADVVHLFSVGEGIAYGSSMMHYLISGAPTSTLRVELSDAYANVEFTSKNLRSWQRSGTVWVVQLHTPVTGAFSLLCTYERPFKSQSGTLAFTGTRPLDAQSELGHTIVTSTHEFQVSPINVSAGLTPLDPAEVPPEYRLLFDAPILAAYRYTARPFTLELALKPLAQARVTSQIIDRASLTTRVSEQGHSVTEAVYFVKNRGTPHLRLQLPEAAELWSVTVGDTTVVPVLEQRACLVPLPQHSDPNTLTQVRVKLASRTSNSRRLTLVTPAVAAPMLITEWRLQPDPGRRLSYLAGSLSPAAGLPDPSGFADLVRLWNGPHGGRALLLLFSALALPVIALLILRFLQRPATAHGRLHHWAGGTVSLIAVTFGLLAFAQLARLAASATKPETGSLQLLAPVQQPDSVLHVRIANSPADIPLLRASLAAWPILLGLIAGVAARFLAPQPWRRKTFAAAWFLCAWGALRMPHGASLFFALSAGFLLVGVVFPMTRAWWRRPATPGHGHTPGSPAPAVALMLLLPAPFPAQAESPPTPESVVHHIRVEGDSVLGRATLRWTARAGQTLVVLASPALLTALNVPQRAARLVHLPSSTTPQQALVAEQTGLIEAEIEYQVRATPRDRGHGFALPTPPGLITKVQLTIAGSPVDVLCPQAVSIQREPGSSASQTAATLVLMPTAKSWVSWQPRARDPALEKPLYFAEVFHLCAPSSGTIDALHQVNLRLAQGELRDLLLEFPSGVTVTDVTAPEVATWRFEPDSRQLSLRLTSPQTKPFTVSIRSQTAIGPLPAQQTIELVRVLGAATQHGFVGIATSADVQLDAAEPTSLGSINLEDFPSNLVRALAPASPGLTLRRAFRYATPNGAVRFSADTVQPDVRVESRQTLSLSEDRMLLAALLDVEIRRAGVFKLSFTLPPELDVESISGAAMTHWTELRTPDGRVVTLHLKGRVEGKEQFNITLAGPGLKPAKAWPVPKLALREASKQRGLLFIAPEQGLRLQIATRDGVTQLDPAASGAPRKGVLAFRLLQPDWRLNLDIERVDSWIQVTSLQHVQCTEGQVKVNANLQYEIENTGARTLRVRLPNAAQSVRFRGDQVADSVPGPSIVTGRDGAETIDWEIKLHRRMVGKYLLQVSYALPLAAETRDLPLDGVQTIDVNLQRGFLSLQAAGRLQAALESVPPALQPSEWQAIPRVLLQDVASPAADYTYRLLDPAFRATLRVQRHDAAKTLPARVTSLTLASVLADDGMMLTHVELQLIPGDKRILQVGLPATAKFWFAFVDHNGVFPWQDGERLLLPLDIHAKGGEPAGVEFLYTSSAGKGSSRSLDLTLLSPKFDLPLENIVWRVALSPKWRLRDWDGPMHLQPVETIAPYAPMDLQTYLSQETLIRQQQTTEAQGFVALANSLLERGDPQRARRALQAAYGMSQHDLAFNEDARVQLQNLKVQQALVGLNVRQARIAGDSASGAAAPAALAAGTALAYTQQQAKQWIERGSEEDHAVQTRLAERLIQQQDAASATPAAIRTALPAHGRTLIFTRPLEIEPWVNLRIGLTATADTPAPWPLRALLLLLALATAAALRRLRP